MYLEDGEGHTESGGDDVDEAPGALHEEGAVEGDAQPGEDLCVGMCVCMWKGGGLYIYVCVCGWKWVIIYVFGWVGEVYLGVKKVMPSQEKTCVGGCVWGGGGMYSLFSGC